MCSTWSHSRLANKPQALHPMQSWSRKCDTQPNTSQTSEPDKTKHQRRVNYELIYTFYTTCFSHIFIDAFFNIFLGSELA